MRKGIPPRVSRIGVVNDDEVALKQIVELIENQYPKLTVRGFDSIFDAYQGMTVYDYLVVDVSAVAQGFAGPWSNAWAPVAKYMTEYRCDVIFCSAVPRSVINELIDEIVERGGICRDRLHYGGWGMWEDLSKTLSELIKPEDCEWTAFKRKGKRTHD